MTVLEQVINVSTNPQRLDSPLKYPIPLSSDSVLSALQIDPQNPNPNPDTSSLVNPLTGFQIAKTDSNLIELNATFFKQLKGKLKNPKSMTLSGFTEMVNPFLEKIGEIKFGGFGELEMGDSGDDYTCVLIGKFGSVVGRDVIGLIIEGCFVTESWKILQTLIVNKMIDYGVRSDLLCNLVAKNRSELVCLCVKRFKDMKGSDLVRVLRYFLVPSKEVVLSMSEVRKEWENEALLAIKKAGDKKVSGKNVDLAKDVALLFMVAYDGFSSWELCLHYLVSSSVDDVVFSSAISKLNVEEMLGLVRYLGKWLRKYEKFPQVGPCSEAMSEWGMKLIRWVPKVEDVVKCLGLVVDEHFMSLAMHSEFCVEMKVIEEVVNGLASQGRFCSYVANMVDILKPEVKAA